MAKVTTNHLGEEKLNKQGCVMKIIQYNKSSDIIIEFQDKYKARIKTNYGNYKKGNILNPYYPTICKIGMKGLKYPASYVNSDGKTVHTKGYDTFKSMITRCYNHNYHKQQITYKDVKCCDEWLNRDNFEDWLRSQPNYKQFLENNFALDKDILVKGNKIYSPETCCLVPQKINELFENSKFKNSKLPIGVKKNFNKYVSYCCVDCKNTYIGTYDTPEKAFNAYKLFKENYIKRIAEEEYAKCNITEQCYQAMMNYQVEITD